MESKAHTIADTTSLIMTLSREAIDEDIYNIQRNASNLAQSYKTQAFNAGLQTILNSASTLINFQTGVKTQYYSQAAGDPNFNADIGTVDLMKWYFN